MRAVADGDFNHPLGFSAARGDEFGRLAASYQEMARRLAELDKLKAEFVSIASHELKTPINVILGYLQLFDEGLYGPLTPRQREVVSTLMSQGQSLARLVQQLLDVSRFEAGGGRLELREVPLEQFVSELETAFHVLAHQREVRFHLLTGEALPETVHWDPDRMNEVLGNLLSNAFKFTDRGGTVELEVTSTAGNVQLVVRDTGAGIPASQLPHIFRKFYQADNQDAAALKGTGLGLAIAKEIVEAHGGEISVDSTPGIGTTFCIRLPVRPRPRRRSGPVTPVHAEAVS
jgi:signal transduction histidine kinase